MARDARADVELVDDDVEEAPQTPAGDEHPGRRRALVAGAALLAVLVTVGVVGQVVVDRRQRAVVAAVAAHPHAVDLLDGPPSVRWSMDGDDLYRLAEVRTADGTLVGVDHSGTGPVAVHAVDVATGAEVWRTELVDGTTRPDPAADDPTAEISPWSFSGTCTGPVPVADVVVCQVHDGIEVWTDDGGATLAPSTRRDVLLDPTDGSVLAELADLVGDERRPMSVVFLGDVMVLTLPGEDAAEVLAVRTDGEVVWRRTLDQWVEAYLELAGDGLLVRSDTEALVLDREGRTLRTASLAGYGAVWTDPSWDTAVLVDTGDSQGRAARMTVLRPEGDVTVEGFALPPQIDDGSAPGLLLTTDGSGVTAWDADGERLWDAPGVTGWELLLMGGRVVTESGTSLVALDARTGEEVWRVPGVSGTPVTDGRHVVAVGHAGPATEVVAVDPVTGEEMWRTPVPDGVDDVTTHLGLLIAVDGDRTTDGRAHVLR